MFRAIGRYFRALGYLLVGKIDAARTSISSSPDVVRATYDNITEEKRKRIHQYKEAVGAMIAQEEKKKAELKTQSEEVAKLQKLQEGAAAMARKAVERHNGDIEAVKKDPDYVKWVDEILPKLGKETEERRTAMEREFRDKIYQKAVNSSDESRAIGILAKALWNRHWDCDYGGYFSGQYVPAYIKSVLGLGRESAKGLKGHNERANDPKSWIKSSDVTVSKPDVWSVEGILSGKYDKLTGELRQWYLHTHGPIEE